MSAYQAITSGAASLCLKADAVRRAANSSDSLTASQIAHAYVLADRYEDQARMLDKMFKRQQKKVK